jgi:hypothetical protein
MTTPYLIWIEHFGLPFINSNCAKLIFRGSIYCLVLIIP